MKLSEVKDVKTFLKSMENRVEQIKALRHGAHITFKLDWVDSKQPYVVQGVVQDSVLKDQHGRERPAGTPGMKSYMRVKYTTHDGHEIDNTFSDEYMIKNLISIDAVRAG
jgi:hypothetical protein